MRRNILLITTDQQRFDALGCNGGHVARTPHIDALARRGLNYTQARNQSTVCMPARATILTGQSIRRHGVTSNGIPLPADAPSIAWLLKDAGYHTALVGKGHLEPAASSEYFENWSAERGSTGPHRGFDHMELCGHTGRRSRNLYHYPKWLAEQHPEFVEGFHEYAVNGSPSNRGGGDSLAPQVAYNPIPQELYHTHWTMQRTRSWLDTLSADSDWFCWMSFPDPHHPWDPPQSAARRFDWRDVPLPAGYPGSPERCRQILAEKPRHWLEWYEGRARFAFEVPPQFVPASLSADQIREVNAMVHAKNELIDDAVGELMHYIEQRGWSERTDVVFTTDHGEFQGDFGALFKGPYHVESLMHVPFIWQPAACANITPAELDTPVGHIDIAPTLCRIAGLPVPDWMQGRPLTDSLDRAPSVDSRPIITEWYDEWDGNRIELQTISLDGYVLTAYGQTNYYDGSEGELYDLRGDPLQWHNLWADPARRGLRSDLLAALRDNLPQGREVPLEKVARV
ncbi:MAG: sulfatase-like hydrolase/transferase [Gammaproteobacteria bacterium]|nr:sulfatase-like hydrolase/transferase [Gammaproteobacteria bacterium]